MLAGVNGAGKSSILGRALERQREIPWFNPDTFAAGLVARAGWDQTAANAAAWHENVRRLDRALEVGEDYAFETTLGGRTIPARILAAARTHDVFIWYCGLTTPERHLARVQARVAHGGHAIPEDKIRERFLSAPLNLIVLMPALAGLQVFDNSVEADPRGVIPNPVPVLSVLDGRLRYPDPQNADHLARTPGWARPLVEAAIRINSDMKSGMHSAR